MNYKDFKQVINLMCKQYANENKLYKLGIDLVDINTPNNRLIELFWSNILTENGADIFSWFMYEFYYIGDKNGKKEYCYYENHKKIVIKTPKELYNYLIKNKCFKIIN